MGTRDELARLAQLCATHDVRPVVDADVPLSEARAAFEQLERGDVFGKLVLTI